MNLWQVLLWLLVAYVIATWAGVIHVIVVAKVFHLEGASTGKFKPSKSPAYKATEPYHPLYNIIAFPICAYLYFLIVSPNHMFREAILLGVIWTVLSIVVDYVGWVLIKHPWNMTVREFYVDYQPRITITYIAILVSPTIAALIFQVVH